MIISEDQMFLEALRLVGREVEIGTKRSQATVCGKVVYAMFDSIQLESNPGQSQVIAFRDIHFLSPVEKESR